MRVLRLVLRHIPVLLRWHDHPLVSLSAPPPIRPISPHRPRGAIPVSLPIPTPTLGSPMPGTSAVLPTSVSATPTWTTLLTAAPCIGPSAPSASFAASPPFLRLSAFLPPIRSNSRAVPFFPCSVFLLLRPLAVSPAAHISRHCSPRHPGPLRTRPLPVLARPYPLRRVLLLGKPRRQP